MVWACETGSVDELEKVSHIARHTLEMSSEEVTLKHFGEARAYRVMSSRWVILVGSNERKRKPSMLGQKSLPGIFISLLATTDLSSLRFFKNICLVACMINSLWINDNDALLKHQRGGKGGKKRHGRQEKKSCNIFGTESFCGWSHVALQICTCWKK